MSIALLASAGKGAAPKLDASDVFSTYLYTGNGSTQNIVNGIDLATKGGMVWFKARSVDDNFLCDNTTSFYSALISNNTGGYVGFGGTGGITSVTSTGFLLGSTSAINGNTVPYVSWTFRKAPKFFDIVTYTGNGVAGRQIPHNLGCEVGMIVVKATNATWGWAVWHRGGQQDYQSFAFLNSTGTYANQGVSGFGSASTFSINSTSFTVGDWAGINAVGTTYVAYLYAHDTSADGIIQCGSFTTDGSGNATVNLGWEPQFGVFKRAIGGTGDWRVQDVMRGWCKTSESVLLANSSGEESTNTGEDVFTPTATGFKSLGLLSASSTYIYMAIRRPNKVPTSGTEVYNAIASTASTGTRTNVGFPIDLQITCSRSGGDSDDRNFFDRLRGYANNSSAYSPRIRSLSTAAEIQNISVTYSFDNTGYTNGSYYNSVSSVFYNFKRAKEFFDIVCYTGTGVARTVNHNLGVVPELMIVKCRSNATNWYVYNAPIGNTEVMLLDKPDNSVALSNAWNNTSPTSSVFTVGTNSAVNGSAYTFVAYLFATLAGISKVGSYTGNGTSQTINCGFTTGARFVLIKRTDSTGDWYIWDTVRGIVSANDPHLSLNTTAAEVTTDDTIDPEASGFIVNQVAATNVNVTSATYIYLAIS